MTTPDARTVFEDRRDAGRQLAALLTEAGQDAIVLALPRGGVPVAAEVAAALHLPLDVLVVRKLGAPFQPELGLGAIAPDGIRVVNARLATSLGVSGPDLDAVAEREGRELERRLERYRGKEPPPAVEGRTVIVVDDGIATGYTARAAVRWAKRHGARRVILAVPVIAAETAEDLATEVDDLVAVEAPLDMAAIGMWYRRFGQVSDEEVVEILRGARRPPAVREMDDVDEEVAIPAGRVVLAGNLVVPAGAVGVVAFAHGSGSGRFSPRNRFVARALREAGVGTLLMDLLTEEEERVDDVTARLRFDIGLLSDRLVRAVDWLAERLGTGPGAVPLAVGCFGASTGGAAALTAAAQRPDVVAAVVSRGGRPDLADEDVLARVRAPTLLVVGGDDVPVIEMNRWALARLPCEKRLEVVPGASHLFPEPGKLAEVARLAAAWFADHLRRGITDESAIRGRG